MVVFCLNGCIWAKWLYSGIVVVFGQKWLYSGKSCSILAKEVVFGQSDCIRVRWLYSGKVAVIGQKCLYSGKWLYSDKIVYSGKS